ncbi:MAG: hypothetical protein FWB78_02600 [Treponema sp.]|nr:hypothetical protein [Treponema sp.]
MTKKGVLVLILSVLVAGRIFAQKGLGSEGNCDASFGRFFSSIGGGIMYDMSRSSENISYRFWSHIYIGPWFFMDMGFLELSMGMAVGRIARRETWCFLIMVANTSLVFRLPFSIWDITPLLGVGFDAIVWVRYQCLRSHYVVSAEAAIPDGRTFRNFSALKFKAGAGRDFALSGNRFFRLRLMGYYGKRFLGYPERPHPWGGTLRVGFGRWLSG